MWQTAGPQAAGDLNEGSANEAVPSAHHIKGGLTFSLDILCISSNLILVFRYFALINREFV